MSDNVVVLFKSENGSFSGFLAKPFWEDHYQLPVAIGNYSYEKEAAQNFVEMIMDSDVGFRHGSTRLEKLANIESLDNIDDCITKAKELTGLVQLYTLYVYQEYEWQESHLFESETHLTLKSLTLTGFYGTPSSKEVLSEAPCINDFKAYINAPTAVLESAIAKAVDVRISGNKSYENHSAVKILCDWWNENIDDQTLKCANNFCLYYWDVKSGMFISCDYEEPACSFENMQEHKPTASFNYQNTKVVAAFIKSDKDADNKDDWATTYKVDGEIWMQIGCNLNEINTSCISMSCLQYLPKSLLATTTR